MPGELSRLDFTGCREVLRRRLAEPAPARVQLVTGPRQVGKTTLLLELAVELWYVSRAAEFDLIRDVDHPAARFFNWERLPRLTGR